MGFSLEQVVPWGRSFDEYAAMFALSADDLKRRILGCGDGPAAFNATLTRRGGRVRSVDPLYRFGVDAIAARIEQTFDQVMDQTRRHREHFVWTTIASVDELGRQRMAAMADFLADYPAGSAQGRYIQGQLPNLPFDDGAFDLALCSHLLFLYSAQLDAAFHLAAVRELCRVAGEVRIFPLLALDATPSPRVQCVAATLAAEGFMVRTVPVPYEFQRGGDRMMTIIPAG